MLATGLGAFFAALGTAKVIGQPAAVMEFQHQEFMRHYAPLGLHTPAARMAIGAWHLACGLMLLFGGRAMRTPGLLGIVCSMTVATACHLRFDPKDNVANAAPAIVLLLVALVAFVRGPGTKKSKSA